MTNSSAPSTVDKESVTPSGSRPPPGTAVDTAFSSVSGPSNPKGDKPDKANLHDSIVAWRHQTNLETASDIEEREKANSTGRDSGIDTPAADTTGQEQSSGDGSLVTHSSDDRRRMYQRSSSMGAFQFAEASTEAGPSRARAVTDPEQDPKLQASTRGFLDPAFPAPQWLDGESGPPTSRLAMGSGTTLASAVHNEGSARPAVGTAGAAATNGATTVANAGPTVTFVDPNTPKLKGWKRIRAAYDRVKVKVREGLHKLSPARWLVPKVPFGNGQYNGNPGPGRNPPHPQNTNTSTAPQESSMAPAVPSQSQAQASSTSPAAYIDLFS